MNYWLDLFIGKSCKEFRDVSAITSGFRDRMQGSVAKVQQGDILLCYKTLVEKLRRIRQLGLQSSLKPEFLETVAEYFSSEHGES